MVLASEDQCIRNTASAEGWSWLASEAAKCGQVFSTGRHFGFDSKSIRFTLACLHRAGINQARQQCRANTGRSDRREACIGASDRNDESIRSERVEACEEEEEEWEDWGEEEEWEDWGEEDKEWGEEEEDGEWEEEEEEEWEEEEEDEVWDEEQQAWADCLEQQGIPRKVYKNFLRAADNLNTLIERLNGLNGCERLVKALRDDRRRRVLLKVVAAEDQQFKLRWKEQLVRLGRTSESAQQWVQDAVCKLKLKAECSGDMLRMVCVCVCVCVCCV